MFGVSVVLTTETSNIYLIHVERHDQTASGPTGIEAGVACGAEVACAARQGSGIGVPIIRGHIGQMRAAHNGQIGSIPSPNVPYV
jgi:hypothetical protein